MASERDGVSTSGAETLKLVLSWLVVGIPAGWGVAQVVAKALALFR